MLRSKLAAELIKHRENDIKIGLTGDDGVTHYYVVIERVAYDHDADVIVIAGHRTFPEDVADDMQRLVRELHEELGIELMGYEMGSTRCEWYVAWRQRCADALGMSVEDL